MATKQRERDDTDLMERPREGRELTTTEGQGKDLGPEQQVVAMTGGDPLTVTVANPTPPTNLSYHNYGTPPTAPGAPFVDDGVVNGVGYGATTAIAAPLSVNPPKGPASEATGTVVVDTDPNTSTSISVQGAYTTTPNASHPSSQAPATLPVISTLSPDNIPATGGTQSPLIVNGTGFEPQSVIYVGGVPVYTFFIMPTQITGHNCPKRTTAGTTPVTVVTGGVATVAKNWTFT